MNTESIVFVVEQDEVRRLLGMYLAAAGLNARTYSTCDDFLTLHDSSQTQYLVLDMQFPGMEGLIIHGQKSTDGEISGGNPGDFQGVPVKSQHCCESFLLPKRMSNDVILNSGEGAFLNIRKLEQ